MTERADRPRGLSGPSLQALERHLQAVDGWPPRQLLVTARRYVRGLESRSRQTPTLDLEMAQRIFRCIETIVDEWEQLPEEARPWLRAAMLYFVDYDDLCDDDAPHGFDDDAEVLNACLTLAGREDLVIEL